MENQKTMLKVIPLGGLGQIGLNTMVLEHQGERVLIDCGILFPRADQLGVDVIVPDFSVLREAPEQLKAIVLTHAHEDHLGALPWLLREHAVPVYGTPFTLALAKHRLDEAGLDADLRAFGPNESVSVGSAFSIEPIQVTHSVPDAVGLVVETPSATVVHSGDFKLDQSPVDGKLTDLARLGEHGERGVDLLLSDSTNAEVAGWTPSESLVRDTFERLVSTARHRVVVTLFGSHLHRVQHLLRLAERNRRRVTLAGRSLIRNVELARSSGRLTVPDGLLVPLDEAASLPREQLLVITTGAQAEPRSGLFLMASDEGNFFRIEPEDLVILSSRTIPGNEPNVTALINALLMRGAQVVHPGIEPGVHVSGHASQQEQRRLIETVRPRAFIPIHGELRHLKQHRLTAIEAGVPAGQIQVAMNGDVVGVDSNGLVSLGRARTGQYPMKRDALAPVSEEAMAERRGLAESGLVIAVIVLRQGTGQMLHGPLVTGRGLSGEEHAALGLARDGALLELTELSEAIRGDDERVREAMTRGIRRVFKQLFGTKPPVHPIVTRV